MGRSRYKPRILTDVVRAPTKECTGRYPSHSERTGFYRSFRTHKTLPLSLRTYRMSTHTFIIHLTYVLSFRMAMIAQVTYPTPQIHGTALPYIYAFSGILYSPLTTDCYVQFPPIPCPPPSALHPPPPTPNTRNLTKSICRRLPPRTCPTQC